MPPASVVLKSGHIQPVWAGHPWIYAQAVERITGGAQPGDEVLVLDPRGQALGRGLYSPGSAIVVRLYTQNAETRLDPGLFARRIEAAVLRRRNLGLPNDETTAYRVVHAEGDELPGLIVDAYGDALVVQIGTIGLKRRQGVILDALAQALRPRTVLDRSSPRAAKLEGFEIGSEVLSGDPELAALEFRELGLRYRVPREIGQKTGFYLDQRPLRARVGELAAGCRTLDAFCFVGSMALAAARGGATSVDAIDSSALALGVAGECAELNGLTGRVHFERADATEALSAAGRRGGYDLVVCDPPKLAPSRAAQKVAMTSMRRLAASACRATRPGGRLVLSSCSAALGLGELTRALALGARDVSMRALVLERLFQGPDHPVHAAFPDGLYLSTLIAEVGAL